MQRSARPCREVESSGPNSFGAEPASSQGKAIAYLCLETPLEGCASHVHATEIIKGLRRLGYRVDFYAITPAGNAPPSLLRRIVAALALQLRLWWRRRHYDLVYVRAHPLAYPISLLGRFLRIPIIHEVNGTYQDIYLNYRSLIPLSLIINSLQRAQYRQAAALITVTPQLERWLREDVGCRETQIAVITNGANPEIFRPGKACALEVPRPYVVFVGSRVPWHDTDVLLRALKHHAWPRAVKLVLVGECSNSEAVQVALRECHNLVSIGSIPHEKVGGVIAGAMAALIAIGDPAQRCSLSGVAPLKLFEALACGVPVIASDLPFQSQLVRELDAGLLYAPGDAHALAHAVAQIHHNTAQFGGKPPMGSAQKEHSWDKRAEETRDFLAAVLERTQSHSAYTPPRINSTTLV